MVILITLITFITVALLAVALLHPLLKRQEVRDRVATLLSPEEVSGGLVPLPQKWQVFLARMGGRLQVKQSDLNKYRELVTTGGFKTDNVYVFLGGKLLLATALPAAYLMLYALPQGKLYTQVSLLVTIACASAGYLLPTWWLSRRVEGRKTEIFHTLPDVLDLLTVSVEAGLSLDAALIRTIENFQVRKNPLIDELTRVTLEIRAGKVRSEALKGLAQRTQVEDLKSFVAMLIQTERFGTSLGKTLRTYSDSLRIRRKQLAEEEAAKTGIKMLFPLTFFVFPGLLVVMLVPAFYKIFAMFKQ